jgi:hypothetical protein
MKRRHRGRLQTPLHAKTNAWEATAIGPVGGPHAHNVLR